MCASAHQTDRMQQNRDSNTLDQEWPTSVLASHSSAEFCSNPDESSPACSFLLTLKTLIILFKCFWLGFKQNSAGPWLSKTDIGYTCTRCFRCPVPEELPFLQCSAPTLIKHTWSSELRSSGTLYNYRQVGSIRVGSELYMEVEL